MSNFLIKKSLVKGLPTPVIPEQKPQTQLGSDGHLRPPGSCDYHHGGPGKNTGMWVRRPLEGVLRDERDPHSGC